MPRRPPGGRQRPGAPRRALVGLFAAGLTAAPAAGQDPCTGPGPARVGAVAGAARFALAGGGFADGAELGIEGAATPGGLAASAAVVYTALGGAAADPVALRLRVGRRVLEVFGLSVCGGGLAGGSAVSARGDRGWTAAGGLALTVARAFGAGNVAGSAHLGARGLAARTGGRVLAQEIAAAGASLGVEAGVLLGAGNAWGALRVTADGFDPGLGATPYPALGLRLVAGWRF